MRWSSQVSCKFSNCRKLRLRRGSNLCLPGMGSSSVEAWISLGYNSCNCLNCSLHAKIIVPIVIIHGSNMIYLNYYFSVKRVPINYNILHVDPTDIMANTWLSLFHTVARTYQDLSIILKYNHNYTAWLVYL